MISEALAFKNDTNEKYSRKSKLALCVSHHHVIFSIEFRLSLCNLKQYTRHKY